MARVIENKEEEIRCLYEDLNDFLEACFISGRSLRNNELDINKINDLEEKISQLENKNLWKKLKRTVLNLFPIKLTNKEFIDEKISENKNGIDCFFLDGADQTIKNFDCWWKYCRENTYWIGITGSWRTINEKVVDDLTSIVRYILDNNFGILTGGALGVDYIATEIVLREGSPEKQLRITLPINKIDYIRHFKNSSLNSKIHHSQMMAIADQITYINRNFPDIIFDASGFDQNEFLKPINEKYREDCYSFRNNLIGDGCDGLIPFWINGSAGVEDTIKTVEFLRKPVFMSKELKYNIDPDNEEVIRDYSELKIPNLNDHYPLEKK